MTSTDIKLAKFFEKGIEFSCQQCGDCCRGLKEGEVYLFKDDIVRLANYLNLNGEEGLRTFTQRYLKVVEMTFFWRDPEKTRGKTYRFHALGFRFTGDDEHCHFLVDNICTVHTARPFQCRCFPFWKMMVEKKKNLVNYSKKCAGLRKLEGRHYSKEEIVEWAQKEYEIEKEFFLKMKEHAFDLSKVYPFIPPQMIESSEK